MTFEEVVRLVLERIERLGIPYMVTGSLALNYYAQPRATHDADLVVELTKAHIPALIEAFEKEFYIDDQMIAEAIHHTTLFNIIHLKSGFKIDFWVRKDDPHSRLAFSRRQPIDLFGHKAFLISVEDLILAKLVWHRQLGSERQFRDVVSLLVVQEGALDLNYLQEQADALKVSDLLEQAREEVRMK